MRIALRLEYDGTDFHGSQLQAKERTVQGELETALRSLFQIELRPALASHTDAGVHAFDQVAAFDVDTQLDMNTVRNALNFYLPKDIAVRVAQAVSAGFHPRRHAISRTYVYKLHDGGYRQALARRQEASVRPPLDIDAMRTAADELGGVRDFAAFAGPATPRHASTVRDLQQVVIERVGHHVSVTYRANAFLHQQVRKMTSALVSVGQGKMSVDEIRQTLMQAVRGAVTSSVPPHGLCLVRIEYPELGPGRLPQESMA